MGNGDETDSVERGRVRTGSLLMVTLSLVWASGITPLRLVTSLTFRMHGKAPASELHSLLWGPFMILEC